MLLIDGNMSMLSVAMLLPHYDLVLTGTTDRCPMSSITNVQWIFFSGYSVLCCVQPDSR